MYTLNQLLKRIIFLQAQLNTLSQAAAKSLKNAPKENHRLRIATRKNKGHTQYYLLTEPGDTHGRYLAHSDGSLVKRLAQRDYDQKVLALANQLSKAFSRFLKALPKERISELYCDTPARRSLITPYVLSNAEYTAQWQTKQYAGLSFAENAPELYTERGERVRSKSEILIANKLNAMGIPYRYECPVVLADGKTYYPDFTLLDVENRRELFLEHLGRADTPDYASRALEKLNIYAHSGYFLGSKLLVTIETPEEPLDIRLVEKMVRDAFDR